LPTFPEQVVAYAQHKRLSDQTLARWQAWREEDQAALLALAEELQLGENQVRDFLDWLEEISARDGETIAAQLTRADIRRPLGGKLSRNDKLKAVKEVLRKVRYPRLSRLEENLRAAVKELDLGQRVRVSFPPALEGDEVTVEIKARNVKELADSLTRLRRRLDEGAVQRIFELLDEV
jgi:CRISPR/Cas system CSM-associated protein Csm2 small subunit